MNTKRKTLVFVIAIVLVVVLIGLPSMNFVQKLSAGCPFTQGKTVLSCNPCLYRTVASPIETGDLVTGTLPSLSPDVLPLINIAEESVDRAVVVASVHFPETTPLRC